MMLVADSVVIRGAVRCESEVGSLQISCSQFEAIGTVHIAPTVIIKERGMRKRQRAAVWSETEEMVPLMVYDHRGHYKDTYHPKY